MKQSRTMRMVGIAVLTAAAATLGFSGTATAQTEDVQQIIEDLPAAAEILADGLQQAATDFADHQSAVQLSADVGATLVEAGITLTENTEQFGSLGLALGLMDLAAQQALAPYLGAIDDPSTAGDLIDPDDLDTLLANVPPTAEHVKDNVTTVLAEALEGNLVEPGFLDPATGTPSVVGNTFAIGGDIFADAGVAYTLLRDTSFGDVGSFTAIASVVAAGAVGGLTGEYLQQLEDGLAPAAEAGEDVTGPLIAVIEAL